MRVLVTGATGLLGRAVVPVLEAAGHEVVRHGLRSPDAELRADLTDPAQVERLLVGAAPERVLSLAAWAGPDRCEGDPEGAFLANARAPELLAAVLEARGVGARALVHVGTDQVFSRPGPSRTGEEEPVNVYGRSKLEGDRRVEAAGGTVVRVNLFGPSRLPGRRSQSDFFLEGFRARAPLVLWTDITFSPLRMQTVARHLLRVLEAPPGGVLGLASHQPMSKRDFALALAEAFGLDPSAARDGTSDETPGRAPRPGDTSMDPREFEEALGVRLPTLREEIAALARTSSCTCAVGPCRCT